MRCISAHVQSDPAQFQCKLDKLDSTVRFLYHWTAPGIWFKCAVVRINCNGTSLNYNVSREIDPSTILKIYLHANLIIFWTQTDLELNVQTNLKKKLIRFTCEFLPKKPHELLFNLDWQGYKLGVLCIIKIEKLICAQLTEF